MGNRTLLALAAAAALAAPRAGAAADGWSLTLGLWAGVTRYDVLGLAHGLGTVTAEDGQDFIDGNFDSIGASGVLRLGWFEVGALYEGTALDADARSEVLTPLVGVEWDPSDRLRLEGLVELGGHRIQGIGSGGALLSATPDTVWMPYLGLRPSVSLRLPVGPARLVLSVTPFARWDLVKKEVTVETSSGVQPRTTYEVGGTTFGLVGGVGVEI